MTQPKHSLFDSFEYKGNWWLPKKPENKIAGTLIFRKNEGITLELMDTPRLSGAMFNDERLSLKIILGVTTDGKYCTLLENHLIGTNNRLEL